MSGGSLLADAFVLFVVAAFWWGVGLLIGLSLARWLTIRAEQIRHNKLREQWEVEGRASRVEGLDACGSADLRLLEWPCVDVPESFSAEKAALPAFRANRTGMSGWQPSQKDSKGGAPCRG